ncbi:MAG: dephospho-CoA kinase [Clostridia bacterium]|nr:dephospho-CoA kinase [Clostridia bacterium]
MKIVGVTGTSGAGKTTVCALLREKYNAYIIDADEIAKRLSKKGSMYLQSIVEYFGQEILDNEGELKRKELATLIYEDDEKRQGLNQLTFMYVVQEIKDKINQLIDKELIVIDAPLLFESKLDQVCDFVIGITAQEKTKIERICNRDHISCEMAKKRLAIQITEEEIRQKADFVIENDGNIAKLQIEFEKLMKTNKRN